MAFNDDDESVGYGRPPKGHQFKPGRSGNPKGRPTGKMSMKSIVQREGERLVEIKENGKVKKMSVARVAARQQWNKAGQGNTESFKLCSSMMSDSTEDTYDGPQMIELLLDD